MRRKNTKFIAIRCVRVQDLVSAP